VLFVCHHAGAQSEATFSIVQEVKTNRCKIVPHKASTTAEQTVLGEFESFAKAKSELNRILICRKRDTQFTTIDRAADLTGVKARPSH